MPEKNNFRMKDKIKRNVYTTEFGNYTLVITNTRYAYLLIGLKNRSQLDGQLIGWKDCFKDIITLTCLM